MATPGNVNPTKIQAPSGQGNQTMKAAGVASQAGFQGLPRMPSSTQHTTDVFQQRRKMPFSPARLAIGGFAIALTLGYFTLYTHKKPEATALDVAKVVTGTATPENTRPRN